MIHVCTQATEREGGRALLASMCPLVLGTSRSEWDDLGAVLAH